MANIYTKGTLGNILTPEETTTRNANIAAGGYSGKQLSMVGSEGTPVGGGSMGIGNLLSMAAPVVGGIVGGPTGYAVGSAVGSFLGGREAAAESRRAASTAAAIADPFANQRGQYQQKLASTVKSPEEYAATYTEAPGYQYRLEQQNKEIERAFAARGMSRSGNLFLELLSKSGELASQEFATDWARQMQYTDLLSTLSGAQTGAPGAAAQTYYTGQQAATEATQGASAALTTGVGMLLQHLAGRTTYTPATVGNIWG